MTDDAHGQTRRSVLRTTGLALAGGTVAAGTASASHLSPGDCAVTETSLGLWDQGCPLQNRFGGVDGGTVGQVLDVCTTDDGEEHVYFSPDTTIQPAGWVVGHALEPC